MIQKLVLCATVSSILALGGSPAKAQPSGNHRACPREWNNYDRTIASERQQREDAKEFYIPPDSAETPQSSVALVNITLGNPYCR